MTNMDYTTQLRMGEIVRQLVAEDDEEFDPALAVELWEMLHGGRPRLLSFKMMGPSSSGVTGVTNTGASVHLKDDELKTYVDTSPSKTWAGKYAVHREDFPRKESAVYIEDRFDATRPAEDKGDAYRMEYKNGRPTGLLKAVRSIFTIPLPWARFNLVLLRYVDWKSPKKASPKYEEIEKFRDELELTNYQAANIISSLLEENKRMKEAFGEVFFEWLHLHDVADSMDLAACVEIEDHEKFEAACHRARSALKEVGNDGR